MLRKECIEGTGYSVVELAGARHVFAAAVPRSGADLQEQAEDALKTIQAVMEEEGTRGSIVQQAVFMKDATLLEECRKIIKEFYGEELPATSYISEPPCDGKLVAIEALGVGQENGGVQIERHSEQLVVTRHNGVTWIHCASIRPGDAIEGVYDRSVDAFGKMQAILAGQGVDYDKIIRTWLYLGDIVGPEGDTQRYKELNRARTDFYKDMHFCEGRTSPEFQGVAYPASTGIGTDGRDIEMSCIAVLSEKDDLVCVPLENPQQTSAFDYAQHYSPKSPKFARAMAITAHQTATIFVSGTASITDSETRYVGDVAGQTDQTLDNIEALISADNLRQHGLPNNGATLDDLALIRVYIKYQDDYPKVRAVCQKRLGNLPTIYAVGDVCRPDLLVEIEGIAFAGPIE